MVGNIETPGTYVGYPARPHGEWGREQIMVTRLPELMKKMRRLEKLLTERVSNYNQIFCYKGSLSFSKRCICIFFITSQAGCI